MSPVSVVPLLVAGQLGFGTITLRVSDQTSVSIKETSCTAQLSGTYTTAIAAQGICSSLLLWVTDAKDCQNEPTATDLSVLEITQAELLVTRNRSAMVDIDVDAMPYFAKNTADGGSGCGGTGIDITHKFCGSVKLSSDFQCFFSPQFVKATNVAIRYDTLPPGAPTIDNVEPFDAAAAVSVSFDSDASTVQIETREPGGEFVLGATLTSTERTKSVSGLINGLTYEVRARAIDAAGNEGPYSELASVTPRPSEGFWGACREAGCPSHGCAAGVGGPFLLLALGSLLIRRRVRR